MTLVRVVDTPLACGPLAAAGIAGTTPPDWYPVVPRGAAAWTAAARTIAQQHRNWLAPIRPAFGDGAKLLDRVAAGGVVVTTGQQAGLFGGPWYTWFKALAALEFAATIERETGVPAVPVFWAATDDADFAEAASTVIAARDGAESLSLHKRAGEGVPMSLTPIENEVTVLQERLKASAGSYADERPLRAAERFRPGVTVGDAYVAMLRELLEPLGMPVLDAAHQCVSDAARAHFDNALANASAIHAALGARQAALQAAGFDVPVEVNRALSLVFAWENGKGAFPKKRRLTVEESASARDHSARLSANVLLRPVIERLILPTAAYFAGPGELAYFSQVSVVADAMRVPRPLAVPRWSGFVLPNDTEETLRRLKLTRDALRDPHAAEGLLARAMLPPEAVDALGDLRAAINREVDRLHGNLPVVALDGAKDQLLRRADKLERRLAANIKRREAETMRAVAAARAILFPLGKPQERALNAVPLWARYGDELITAIRASCDVHARRVFAGESVTA